jgi:hypothetical protein
MGEHRPRGAVGGTEVLGLEEEPLVEQVLEPDRRGRRAGAHRGRAARGGRRADTADTNRPRRPADAVGEPCQRRRPKAPGAYRTAVVRCAPPANHPLGAEEAACRPFLRAAAGRPCPEVPPGAPRRLHRLASLRGRPSRRRAAAARLRARLRGASRARRPGPPRERAPVPADHPDRTAAAHRRGDGRSDRARTPARRALDARAVGWLRAKALAASGLAASRRARARRPGPRASRRASSVRI